MGALSKQLVQPLFNQRLLLANGKNSVLVVVRHSGHERVFRRRQGQLINNRMKDHLHFYFIGLGFIPGFIIFSLSHIFFGNSCELKEYPKEGEEPPHYWQFERTPIRQFWQHYIYATDIQYHEGWASRFSNWQIKDRWRRIERRVHHLIGERQDYKAYHYHPVTHEWIDMARRRAAQQQQHFLMSSIVTGRDAR